MSDLISRQAAIDYLLDALYDLDEADYVDKEFIEEELKRVPSVQPEQKTGQWIEYCGDLYCSMCGFRNSNHYCLGEGIACPNCGAFMPDGLKNVLG